MAMLVARLIFASLVLHFCATASAFNTGGHMVIGLIAYDQMEPADRNEVVLSILRNVML